MTNNHAITAYIGTWKNADLDFVYTISESEISCVLQKKGVSYTFCIDQVENESNKNASSKILFPNGIKFSGRLTKLSGTVNEYPPFLNNKKIGDTVSNSFFIRRDGGAISSGGSVILSKQSIEKPSSTISAKEYCQSAVDHYNTGNIDAALLYFTKAGNLAPNDVDIISGIGHFCMVIGKYDLSIDYFTKALNLNPNDSSLYDSRALAHFFGENLADAIIDAEQAINLDPNLEQAYFIRGFGNLYHCHNTEQAVKDFETSLQLDPDDEEAKNQLEKAKMYQKMEKNARTQLIASEVRVVLNTVLEVLSNKI